MAAELPNPYVSRGGLKLQHALREFSLDITGFTCADFGCSTGGFTHCMLEHGAAKVYAIDTAYGELAWKLRNDPRVVVMERTNCLHAKPPREVVDAGGVDLITIDASWTPQRLVLPAAAKWIKQGPPSAGGIVITLIKPHYELKDLGEELPRGGVLEELHAERVAMEVAAKIGAKACVKSPITGGAGKSKGNAEWLALVEASKICTDQKFT